MKIKIKKQHKNSFFRVESNGEIKEIMINEDMRHPQKESVLLCYIGKDSSGIVELSTSEVEKLYDRIKPRLHLIKGFKRLSGSGALI